MHPEIIERMLAERVNDLRREAAAAHRAAEVRRHRHGWRTRPRPADARPVVAERAVTERAVTERAAVERAVAGRAELGPEHVPAEPVGAGPSGRRAA